MDFYFVYISCFYFKQGIDAALFFFLSNVIDFQFHKHSEFAFYSPISNISVILLRWNRSACGYLTFIERRFDVEQNSMKSRMKNQNVDKTRSRHPAERGTTMFLQIMESRRRFLNSTEEAHANHRIQIQFEWTNISLKFTQLYIFIHSLMNGRINECSWENIENTWTFLDSDTFSSEKCDNSYTICRNFSQNYYPNEDVSICVQTFFASDSLKLLFDWWHSISTATVGR